MSIIEFPPYLRALTEGVNVSVFMFGATGSGKTHCMEGNKSDPGLISLLADNLFNILEDKRYRQNAGGAGDMNPNFTFSVKVRFIEIVDEEIHDLLQPTGAYGHHSLNVILNEWEGPMVNGVNWIPMTNQHQLADFFVNGSRNRTTHANEFGKLSEKAAGIFSIEITQITDNPQTGDTHVLVSKLDIIDMPGSEILNEDPENVRVKQGSTLNRGMLSLNNLMKELSVNPHGDYVFYDGSKLTELMKDVLGGNSLTVGVFTLQYGDPIGSTLTMRAFKKCQTIMNFPAINDSRTIGLLRKFRIELISLYNQVNMKPGDNADNYNLKIAELEKKLIDENLEKMKFTDEKTKLINRMQEMKSKFNELVRSKADLQAELIQSEEEKLKVSKALIELQIENTKLQEMISNNTFDVNTKLLHAENDLLELNIKEERAAKAIQELQEKLREALDDKKEIEIEFVALKKNFINIQQDLDQEKVKNENLGIELVNLVNENKALQSDSNQNNRKAGQIGDDFSRIERRNEKLAHELQETKEALIVAKGEIERLKTELIRYDLQNQQNNMDLDNKKMELEREFLELTRNKGVDNDRLRVDDLEANKRLNLEREMWDGEKTDLLRKIKELNRKIEELTDDIKIIEEQNIELKSDKNRIMLQLEEMRSAYRNKLTKYMNEHNPDQAALTWQAKEELIRSYTEKEQDYAQALDRKEKTIEDLRKKLRALKRYARQLKYLAEDWAPLGQPLPEILTMPPPISLEDDDDDDYLRRQQTELDRVKNRNRNLEEDLRRLTDGRPMDSIGLQAQATNYSRGIQQSNFPQSVKSNVSELDRMRNKVAELENELARQQNAYTRKSTQKSAINDPEMLRLKTYIQDLEQQISDLKRALQMAQLQQNDPRKSLASMHSMGVQKVDDIQERLLQEITYLKGNQDFLNKPGTGSAEVAQIRRERDALNEENKKLKALMNEDSAGPSSGNAKYLKNKIFHLEKTLSQLEKERSELSVRATMAEEQVKQMQEYMSQAQQTYKKKEFDMKKMLKSKGVDVSMY
ncbi:kinesin-like protein [Stylonychia lemnae]|uniref:Kinesin-like protein n=1 Tax=Stylonychia lemnae TaxID=5949 RepID=A0A078B749_STYLE|nr:kinesin-like protein [Stylonychia lemnae]|eukprot:CDW90229.1 kinesin-like protein [Stylonychia lemnae]